MQDADSLTPMFRQYRALKGQNPGAILLFRMGDFYEMFHEDAEIASKALDLALTARGKGTANAAPMCGFPHHQLDAHAAKLVRGGHRVAVCDQVEDPKLAKGLVRREVVRIVTPGTLDDPNELDARANTWIAAVAALTGRVGAAFLDASTGEFVAWEEAGPQAWGSLGERLDAFAPRELVHADDLVWPEGTRPDPARCAVTTNDPYTFTPGVASDFLKRHFEVASLDGYGLAGRPAAIAAAGGLLAYVKDTIKSGLEHVDGLASHEPAEHVLIDTASFRALEIDRALRDGARTGSLLHAVDRTLTPPGARLLRSWIAAPLLAPDSIAERHEAVLELLQRPALRADARARLDGMQDIERLLARTVSGTATARDLLALKASLSRLPALCGALGSARATLLRQIAETDPCAALAARLADGVHEEPPAGLREGGLIRDGFHGELDELRTIRSRGRDTIAAIEVREREATGIASLKVRFNRVFGYYIEVSKSNLSLVPERYQRKQTIAGGERFVTPEIKEYEAKVLGAQERIESLEYEIFVALRAEVAASAPPVKAAARAAARADVLSGFAQLAEERDFRRPTLVPEPRIRIIGGRHPVVEQMLVETRFAPNDATLGKDAGAIAILTGPNMGGKSTYLRQVALIAILAQAGSFVPAEEAEIGIVDRIFCRVGASDNLAEGQSTFMVEMAETANILHHVTPRSLVLLDEIGRGTATFDGLAIAWAVVEYLQQLPGGAPRTIFATHYHELTELAVTLTGIVNLRMAVREWGDRVIFTHRVESGPSDRSYGIHVARLAGVPQPVVARAEEILANLERDEYGGDGLPRRARKAGGTRDGAFGAERPLFPPPASSPAAPSQDDPAAAEVLSEIRRQTPERLTPLEALTLVDGWSRRLKQETVPKK
jgi:DNA mismatch repair protein MutS